MSFRASTGKMYAKPFSVTFSRSSAEKQFFIDNEIKRGEFIGPELRRAIRGSKIAVVLLSKNYASSSWCLDELVEIMKKELGQTVITVFYEVDPTDVKKQKGDFGKVFKKTCEGKDEEKVQTWRKALEGVATIAGYHSRNWDDEATMIESIAVDILNKLNHLTPSSDFDRLIGMGAHMKRMELLLRLDLDEVRMIGIWGPPGIGKTTIARVLFNQLSSSFQNSAFMVNIRESYPRSCLEEYSAQLQLQKQMLSEMINHKDIIVSHLGVAQGRLRDRTVLLVLDGVDRLAQLEALAKNVQWFGPRSRIIITAEDLQLFRAHGINHIYEVNFPSTDEALQMFCMYAFHQKSPKDGFGELAREITYLVGELPLGLKVMGSHFQGLSKEQWPMEVSRLRTNLNGEIESILKFSYDALCDEDKDLFLHIACFFKSYDIEIVKEILPEKFKYVRQRLHVLAEKSLISIELVRDDKPDRCEYIEMHNLLVQLGKKIVCKDLEPGQRKFLMDYKDISEVLTGYTTISGSVIGIDSYDQLNITEKAFEGMSNLEFLRVRFDRNHDNENKISSQGPLTFISPKLRLLDWWGFPMTCLRFTNNLEFLVELRMLGSKLEKLWDGIKLLRNLKRMDLAFSKNLKELPNLSTATNLQKLNLCSCTSLVELPHSIGNATNLRKLNLSRCTSLVELPSSIGNLTNLTKLYLEECSSLLELPSSIGNATNLQELNLSGCTSLVELLSSIMDLPHLYFLSLDGCSSIVELPSSIENVTNRDSLNLGGWTSLVELPSSIGNATSITQLYLRKCSSLVELPPSIGNLTNLEELDLNGCSSLVSLPQLPASLRLLDAENCESLEKLDCSFCNPDIWLNFSNCFNLNQEARDLLIQTSTCGLVVLPGKEVPACFTYRAYGSSVTLKLNQKPLRTSTKFKACILFVNKDENDARYIGWHTTCVYTKKNKDGALLDDKGEHEVAIQERGSVSCCIRSEEYNSPKWYPILTEHLYIFEVEAEEVTSTELDFEFELDTDDCCFKTSEIKECGIVQLLKHHDDGEEEMYERRSDQLCNDPVSDLHREAQTESVSNSSPREPFFFPHVYKRRTQLLRPTAGNPSCRSARAPTVADHANSPTPIVCDSRTTQATGEPSRDQPLPSCEPSSPERTISLNRRLRRSCRRPTPSRRFAGEGKRRCLSRASVGCCF